MPPTPSTARSRGQVETELLEGPVLITSVRGHVTAQLILERFEQFRICASRTQRAAWIIDCLELTSFDPAAVTHGARWFDVFKQQCGEHVLFVSNMAAARMAAATLAFAVHVKISCCREIAQAYDKAGLGSRSLRPSQFTMNPPKSSVRSHGD